MHLSRFKYFVLILALAGLSFSISCGDQIDIPKVPLEGKINGMDWSAADYGNTTLVQGGPIPKFTYRLLSAEDPNSDSPCSGVSTTIPHVRMVLPLGTGSYSIPFPDFSESVKFDYGNGTVIHATSGIVEIFAMDQFQIAGYIEAFDGDKDSVKGRFLIEIC